MDEMQNNNDKWSPSKSCGFPLQHLVKGCRSVINFKPMEQWRAESSSNYSALKQMALFYDVVSSSGVLLTAENNTTFSGPNPESALHWMDNFTEQWKEALLCLVLDVPNCLRPSFL